MARKLKVYQTSQGFYDLAVAAPSMKAALEAWGAGSNLFQQGYAKESTESGVTASALKHPGAVLRRPVGSTGAFREQSGVPKVAALEAGMPPSPAVRKSTQDKKRQALAKFQHRQRERQSRQDAQAAVKAEARHQAAVVRAQRELGQAQRRHDDIVEKIEHSRAALQARAEAETKRWSLLKERLEAKLHHARN